MFKDSVDLLIVKDLAMILLSFSGFLRYDEVSSLRFNDVKVHDNHLPTLSHKPRYKRDERMTHCLTSLLSKMQPVLVVQVWHSDRVVK
jgi:hypothetical protein